MKSTVQRSDQPLATNGAKAQESMRDRIKAIATDLFIQHGYRGVSFGDIATELGITRANIHYHFGNKQNLLDELLEEYVDGTLERMRQIWRNETDTFADKLEGIIAFNRERYLRFNQRGDTGNHWSLITRMRNDSDAIGERSRRTLQKFGLTLSSDVEAGVQLAIKRGEMGGNVPIDQIVLQAVSIVNAAGTIAQDAGNFDRLDALYRAFLGTVQAAYGGKPKAKSNANTRTKRDASRAHNLSR